MPSNFDLSSLAKSLKAVGDAGAALCADCEARATDGKVTDADIGPLTKALFDIWTVIAPTGEAAADTDPALAEQETLKRKQEVATGDRKKANDGVIHNIESIFGGGKHDGEGASVIAPSIDGIFGGSKPAKLAKG